MKSQGRNTTGIERLSVRYHTHPKLLEALYAVLEKIELIPTTANRSLIQALDLLKMHKRSKKERLPLERDNGGLPENEH